MKTTTRASAFIAVVLAIASLALDVGCKGRGLGSLGSSFPRACPANEEIEVSGNYEGTGPIITSVGANCKLHITGSKLKGSTFISTDATGLELTLDNVTIETTDTTIAVGGSGTKVTIHGSTLTSTTGAAVFDVGDMEAPEIVDSTIDSKAGYAFKSKAGLTIKSAQNVKIRGKRGGLQSDSDLEIDLKKASEITSSDGIALKSTSHNVTVKADGGKIEGATAAIVSGVDVDITARGLALSSSKGDAINSADSVKLDFTDGSIVAGATAIAAKQNNLVLTFDNTSVQGARGISMRGANLTLKALKKTRIVATAGDGIVATDNAEITVSNSSIEAAGTVLKARLNAKLTLLQGARLAGKRGGIDTTGNLEIAATATALEGGTGPAITTGSNAEIVFQQGTLRGSPAILTTGRPNKLVLDGSKVDGEKKQK